MFPSTAAAMLKIPLQAVPPGRRRRKRKQIKRRFRQSWFCSFKGNQKGIDSQRVNERLIPGNDLKAENEGKQDFFGGVFKKAFPFC